MVDGQALATRLRPAILTGIAIPLEHIAPVESPARQPDRGVPRQHGHLRHLHELAYRANRSLVFIDRQTQPLVERVAFVGLRIDKPGRAGKRDHQGLPNGGMPHGLPELVQDQSWAI